MNGPRYYKISELSRLASVPVPTIRFYLKEGLLGPAVKTGRTMAFYTDDHLERLSLIRRMRRDEGKSISRIKGELGSMPENPPVPGEGAITSSEKRDEIISAAIGLFIKNGLGGTSIDDIAAEAHIGKGTFYRYFKDKNDLFIECAESIFNEMYSNVWDEIKNEKNIEKRLLRRARAFFDSYPKWIDMMNLLRNASVGSDRFFKEKFRSVLDYVTKPIAHDLEILKKQGRMRPDTDCREVAFVLMGIAEYAAALIQTGKYKNDEIIAILQILMEQGLKND